MTAGVRGRKDPWQRSRPPANPQDRSHTLCERTYGIHRLPVLRYFEARCALAALSSVLPSCFCPARRCAQLFPARRLSSPARVPARYYVGPHVFGSDIVNHQLLPTVLYLVAQLALTHLGDSANSAPRSYGELNLAAALSRPLPLAPSPLHCQQAGSLHATVDVQPVRWTRRRTPRVLTQSPVVSPQSPVVSSPSSPPAYITPTPGPAAQNTAGRSSCGQPSAAVVSATSHGRTAAHS